MEDAGRHLAFVWAAYGTAAFVTVGLVGRAILRHLVQRRALVRLEADAAVRGARDGADA